MPEKQPILEKLIKQAKFDFVNENITTKNFPDAEFADLKDAKLFHFNRYISSDEAIAEMRKENYRPASVRELVAYAIKNPEEQTKHPIVALGQDWSVPDGDRSVAYLGRWNFKRNLSLGYRGLGWNGCWRFLAFSESKTLGPLVASELKNGLTSGKVSEKRRMILVGQNIASKIPKSKMKFNKKDYWQVIDDSKLTTSQIVAEMRKSFKVWIYDEENLDKNFPAPAKKTIRYFCKNVEADPDLANKSAEDLEREGIEGITLRERLLLELQYFKETGNHLDKDSWTLCAGSRNSVGCVPCVHWYPDGGEVYVRWFCADFRDSYVRSRVAVSFNPSSLKSFKSCDNKIHTEALKKLEQIKKIIND